MKDEQATNWLPLLQGEKLNLVQQAAARGLVERGEHLLNGAVICCQINDVVKHVFALHHVHSHMREAHIVLHEIRHRNHRLHHLMHQDELLSILQIPLR